ncbi:MAG: multicopper oxidase domain-containing protein [Gemmatimonadetes bacterium]|nr:multicopper oxidase domain-containing protein [Gemmatimonadota bacterium]
MLAFRTGLDAQLTGAIVVDPRGAVPNDRIFVLGMWTDTVARSFVPRHRVLGVVNGRSWPHSERITATVGDSVRWRLINASGDLHPMHLHGFYFRVTSRGDGTTDTHFTADRAQSAVTEAMNMGRRTP